MSDDTVARRLERIRGHIDAACRVTSRDPRQIVLVGACKRQPLERLQAAREAGLLDLGENLVQEALRHQAELPAGITWHLIGPLQSNKATKAVLAFSWIHSVDRLKIAAALERAAASQNRRLHGLLEVNLGYEPSKHGFSPRDLPALVEPLAEYQHLKIEGLMAIPPFEANPEESRGWFRQLRELRDELFSLPAWSGRPGYLSMGMSADYAVAIEEGATHVRVGTSLFGARVQR